MVRLCFVYVLVCTFQFPKFAGRCTSPDMYLRLSTVVVSKCDGSEQTRVMLIELRDYHFFLKKFHC